MHAKVRSWVPLTIFGTSLALLAYPALAQKDVIGTWDAPVELTVDGVHATVLPSGKVLYVPHQVNPGGTTTSVVFDPDNPGAAKVLTVPSTYFCGGHSQLGDGRAMFVGGETFDDGAIDKAGYFDHVTETWTELADMNRVRWYPSVIELGDGTIWSFGGQSVPADPDKPDNTIEFYDPETNVWTMAGGQDIPEQYLEAYNRLHLMPDGKIFQPAHLPETYLYDPVARTWTFVAKTQLGRPRGNGSSVRLQDGRILIVGGEDKVDYFSSAEVIDLSQPSPQWQTVASMTSVRAFIDAIVLPDGRVLVVGGDEGSGSRSKTPELYDPVTNSWTDMAPFAIERGYHSTTLLLPDARVIVSGGEGNGGPGMFGESAEFEIWNPYYLFKSARPEIDALPAAAGYGQQVTMSYTSAVGVSHVVIHRSGSQTHSFSYNQISVPVSFDSTTASTISFTLPGNANLLPPGFYMVFLLNDDGVPSVAKYLRIGGSIVFSDGFESGDTSEWTASSALLGATPEAASVSDLQAFLEALRLPISGE